MFELANTLEAVLWWAVAAAVLTAGVRRRWPTLPLLTLTAALVLFGLSDLVETRTGAWYKPWWLLLWKAACIAAILACAWHIRRARPAPPKS